MAVRTPSTRTSMMPELGPFTPMIQARSPSNDMVAVALAVRPTDRVPLRSSVGVLVNGVQVPV